MKTKFAVVLGTAIAVMSGAALAAGQWQDVPEGVDSVSTPGDWESLADQSSFVWAPEVQGNTKVPGTFLGTEGKQTFNKTLWVSGNTAAAQATGLAVSGANGDLTNAGTIYVTSGQTTAEDGTVTGTGNAWQNKAIWTGNGATATNTGTIVAKNAYGMTVGKDGAASKLFNEGTIYVEEKGVGIELGGAEGSSAVNRGTVVVGANDGETGSWTHGVLIKDQNNAEFTNYGTIDASADNATAIDVQVEDKTTDGTILNFGAGSRVLGEVHIQKGVTNTVLNANGFNGTVDLNNESDELTINVNDDANIVLEDGNDSTISSAVINDGMLTASIWQNYEVEGEDGQKVTVGDNTFKSVTINEGGVFNVKRLNSGGTGDDHNTLLIKGGTYTLNGGALYVNYGNYTGNVKVGTSTEAGVLTIQSGNYTYDALSIGKLGTVTVGGNLTVVGSLAFSAGAQGNTGLLTIEQGGTVSVGDLTTAKGTLKLNGGTLVSSYENFFTPGNTENSWVVNENVTNIKSVADSTGVIEFTDAIGEYSLQDLKDTQAQFNTTDPNAIQIVFQNGTLTLEDGEDLTDTSLSGLNLGETVGDATKDGDFTVSDNTTVAGVNFGKAETATIGAANDKALTITGDTQNGDVFVFDAESKVNTVTATNINLGEDQTSSGKVNVETLALVGNFNEYGTFTADNVTVDTTGTKTVYGNFSVDSLSGEGTMNVGAGGVFSFNTTDSQITLQKGATVAIGGYVEPEVQPLSVEVPSNGQVNDLVDASAVDTLVTVGGGSEAVFKSALEKAGVEYDEETHSGICFADTLKLDTEGRVQVSSLNKAAANGEVAVGNNGIAVISGSRFMNSADFVIDGAARFGSGATVVIDGLNSTGSINLAKAWNSNGTNVNFQDNNAFFNQAITEVPADAAENAGAAVIDITTNEAAFGGDEELYKLVDDNLAAHKNVDTRNVLTAIGREDGGFIGEDGILTDRGASAIEEYFAMPVTAGTYNVAYDATEQVTATIQRRNLEPSTGLGVWADVFYASNEAETMYGDSGYSADIYGGTIGFDGTFSCGAKLGLALSVGNGDADSEKSVGKYGNDADFWGVSIYTGKDIAGLYFSADASYLSFDNDITGSVAGASVKENIDSSVFTIGVRADMTVWDEGFKVVPHVGLRYTKIDVDDYRGLDSDSMDVFETPIGVKIAGDFEPSAGWTLTPSFDFTIVPQLGDKDVNTLIGDVDVLDNVYNSTLGVNASYGNFTFGLSYRYGFGTNDRSNNAFQARAAYAF